MKKPFFSIVIPTRNRADTLEFTIKTVLQQSFKDYELIICDNNSQDNTKEVVKKINSPMIKYICTNQDLAMHDNWEFALSKVKGKYITVISDNDGLINNSLKFLYELLLFNDNPNIIRWNKNLYNWPSFNSINKNMMLLNANTSLVYLNSKKMIEEVLEGKKVFQDLPMIYNSVISHKLVKKLKNKTGRIFNSINPDVYTGMAFAYLNKNYLSLSMPITIGSNSAKSNGYNCNIKTNSIEKEFKLLAKKSEINFHKQVPFIKPSKVIAVADSFLKAKETLNINDIKYDRKYMLQEAIKIVVIYDNNDLKNTKKLILESCKDNIEISKYAKKLISNLKVNKPKDLKVKTGFKNCKLTLFADNYNLNNVYDVSRFMSTYYNYSLDIVNLPTLSKDFIEIPKNERVAIWGTGVASIKFQKKLLKLRNDIKVKYIIDSFNEDLTSSPKIILPKKIKKVKYIIIASMYLVDIKKVFDSLTINKSDIKLFKYV